MTTLKTIDKKSTMLADTGLADDAPEFEESNDSLPRVMSFYGKQGELGPKVKAAIREIEDGEPFIMNGESFVGITEDDLFCLFPTRVFQYWAIREAKTMKLIKFSAEKKKSGSDYKQGQTGWREEVLAIHTIMNENGVTCAVSTFDKSRARFPKQFRDAYRAAKTKEWAAESTMNAAHVKAKTPLAFRLVASMDLEEATSGGGYAYLIWNADSRTSDPDEANRLIEFANSEDGQAQYQDAVELYESLKEKLIEKA